MRTLSGTTGRIAAIVICLGNAGPLLAQQTNNNSYQNNSQFGMSLPQTTLPSGQDEIRTSDGTSCRSSVGGNGAYFDGGVIGTPEGENINSTAAAYGRIVIPLGRQAERLDCTTLYSLEIERLKMELRAAQMGIGGKAATQPAELEDSWANEGWGDKRSETTNMLSADEPVAEKQSGGVEEPPKAVAQKKKKKIIKSEAAVKNPAETDGGDGWVEPVNAEPEIASESPALTAGTIVHPLYGGVVTLLLE